MYAIIAVTMVLIRAKYRELPEQPGTNKYLIFLLTFRGAGSIIIICLTGYGHGTEIYKRNCFPAIVLFLFTGLISGYKPYPVAWLRPFFYWICNGKGSSVSILCA